MVAVKHKCYLFAWKGVSMWTHMYKENKMTPGFTMAKEKTILCEVVMLEKMFTWSKLLFNSWES